MLLCHSLPEPGARLSASAHPSFPACPPQRRLKSSVEATHLFTVCAGLTLSSHAQRQHFYPLPLSSVPGSTYLNFSTDQSRNLVVGISTEWSFCVAVVMVCVTSDLWNVTAA